MSTFRTGISTAGLHESPLPEHAWSRLYTDPGKYAIKASLARGTKLELITDGYTFNHFTNLLGEINRLVMWDFEAWEIELETLGRYARDGVDLTELNVARSPLHIVKGPNEQ